MPAVPFIISFAVESAIGAAVAEAVGAEIMGSTLLADAATGAIKGGISGGISAAAQGGDVEQGVTRGAAGGAAGGAVTGQVGQPDPTIDAPLREASGLSAVAPTQVAKGGGAAAGTLATGGTPKQALVGGLVTTGLDYAYGDTKGDPLAAGEKAVIGKTLTDYFAPAPTRSAQTVGGGGGTAAPEPTSVTTTGAGQAPGSQALSQALRIGDPGAPILGSSDKEGGGKESGWNVSSLRYMGQES
jgi:hypothetical protein